MALAALAGRTPGAETDEVERRLRARAHAALGSRLRSRAPLAEIAQLAREGLVAAPQDDGLARLALDAANLLDRRHRERLRRRETLLARVDEGLHSLRRLQSSAELVDAVCPKAVEICDFKRVMISRIRGNSWFPWMIAFSPDTGPDTRFEEWMAGAEIPFDEMALESEVLATGRAALVTDAYSDERTYKPIVRAARSPSYVVAPIIPAGRVVGFLHASYTPTMRVVDEVDRDVLWAFAEGFGRMFERTIVLERMRAQRISARQTFEAAEEMMTALAHAEIELVGREELDSEAGTLSPAPPAAAAIDGLLTEREREVLAMMVRGLTNRVIAEQLVIKEGTVKSHVKHILRKVGAVNRTEAIALYLGASA